MSVAAVRTGQINDSALTWYQGAIMTTIVVLVWGVVIVALVILGVMAWRKARRAHRAEQAEITSRVEAIKARRMRSNGPSVQRSHVEDHQDGSDDPASDPDAPRARPATHALRSDREHPSEPPPNELEQTLALFSLRPYMSVAQPPRDGAGRMTSERV